ncbi:catalase [Sedimentitalea nanhaiensis]|uniref:catalase n=1 Tax=Sedimentitalea nanhaiensis TaxID=999627 RepID=A0A1I7CZY2_9RHOB|nr:catalase [Sedimentitalea nanhaiensis]SFU04964.1 catalase [Sedimentitalea nanhaiensis]
MEDPGIAERLVDSLVRPDGSPKKRPVHTIGIGATGSFLASHVARDYCISKHFQGTETPVTVRFSNGSGSAVQHDGWSDVRGMATRFHLDDGTATDLIAMTLPEFFTPTPETFLDFALAAKPAKFSRESPWRKILDMLKLTPPMRDPYPGETVRPDEGAMRFADRNGYAQLAVFQAAAIGAPASYDRASYHAVHTFVITAPDGTRRWVRFTWQPIAGVLDTNPNAPPEDVYLQDKLRERLALAPARFSLMMSIGEIGDAFDDPTRPWPPHRVRVMMGTLTLDTVVKDQEADCERLSFNPGLLTDGIEPSGDLVLRARKDVYEISSKRRGAVPCPFSRSQANDE